MAMPKRALLVTFDAWKTIFTPTESVAAQYTRLARIHGMDVEESGVEAGFARGTDPRIRRPEQLVAKYLILIAFKSMYSKYPNYGKTHGMNPEQWWTKVGCH